MRILGVIEAHFGILRRLGGRMRSHRLARSAGSSEHNTAARSRPMGIDPRLLDGSIGFYAESP